jgi:hypothetical protein
MNFGDVRDITDKVNEIFGYDLREYGWSLKHIVTIEKHGVEVNHNEKLIYFRKGVFVDATILRIMLRNKVSEFIDVNTGYLLEAFRGLYEDNEIKFAVVDGYAAFKCTGVVQNTNSIQYTHVGNKRLLGSAEINDDFIHLALQSQIGERSVSSISMIRKVRPLSPSTPIYVQRETKNITIEVHEDRKSWDEIFTIDLETVTPNCISFVKHHITLELFDENYHLNKEHDRYTLSLHNGVLTYNRESIQCKWSESILGYGDLSINPYNRSIAEHVADGIVYDGQYIFKNHEDTYVRVDEKWIMVDDRWFYSPRIPQYVKDEYAMSKNFKGMGV